MSHLRPRLAAAILCGIAAGWLAAMAAPATNDFKPFELKSPEGKVKTLQDFLNKATLITFFFPTCPSCNAEFPLLQKMFDKYNGQGFSMVAINILPEQNPSVAKWRAKHKYSIPALLCANQETMMNDYDLKMTPTHFLLDSKGKVILKQVGYSPGNEKALEDAIQKALGLAP